MPVNKKNLQFSKIAAKQSLNHNPEGVSDGEGKRREEDFTASHFVTQELYNSLVQRLSP